MTAELVGPLPTITFYGAGRRVRQGYDVPRNTCDLRARLCTDHHPACDCREAELAEQLSEHRAEWRELQAITRSALANHQIDYPRSVRGELDQLRFGPLCLCTGCVIVRESHHTALNWADIDWRTGRVLPPRQPQPSEEVPF